VILNTEEKVTKCKGKGEKERYSTKYKREVGKAQKIKWKQQLNRELIKWTIRRNEPMDSIV